MLFAHCCRCRSPPQVQFAFLAGLAVVLTLIPINQAISRTILKASVAMMQAKDRWGLTWASLDLELAVLAGGLLCWNLT